VALTSATSKTLIGTSDGLEGNVNLQIPISCNRTVNAAIGNKTWGTIATLVATPGDILRQLQIQHRTQIK